MSLSILSPPLKHFFSLAFRRPQSSGYPFESLLLALSPLYLTANCGKIKDSEWSFLKLHSPPDFLTESQGYKHSLLNYPVSIYPALTPPGAQVSFRYFKFNVTKTDAIFSSSTPNLLLLQVAHAKTSAIILCSSFFPHFPHLTHQLLNF